MSNTLFNAIHEFAWERIEYDAYQNCIMKNDRYIKAEGKRAEFYEIINKCASPEMKTLLFRYDELCNNVAAIREGIIYKHGMKDGIRFINTLTAIREDGEDE
jgi:hypothetical protein